MIISREFLMSNVTALEPVEVECPEWGGTVLVERALAKKQNAYAELVERMDKLNPNIGLVITFCVDENGKNLFTEADAEWLGNQPLSVINRLANRIAEENGFTKEVQEAAEENFEKADS